jgi:hypothetical protein
MSPCSERWSNIRKSVVNLVALSKTSTSSHCASPHRSVADFSYEVTVWPESSNVRNPAPSLHSTMDEGENAFALFICGSELLKPVDEEIFH